MKKERGIWILIVCLLIGIILLEFIFLGGAEALANMFENFINGIESLINWIRGLIP